MSPGWFDDTPLTGIRSSSWAPKEECICPEGKHVLDGSPCDPHAAEAALADLKRYTDLPGQPFAAEPGPGHPFVVMIYEHPCTRSGQDAWQAHEHVREGIRNGLSYATAEDAETYARDLAGRWFGFDHWAVVNFLTGEEVRP